MGNATMAWLDGIILPMVTPFRNGAIDVNAAQRLAVHYRDAGVSSLVLFGSTGEGNLVTPSEQARMFEAVSEAIDLPLLVGAGGVDTRSVVASVRRLDRLMPAGYLVPPPYYLRPAQDGIVWHYRQIAQATVNPIILYDVAARTGSAMTVQTMETLYALPNIVGVKACDASLLGALVARSDMRVLCGEDRALLSHFERGGRGAISASAHIRPDLFVALFNYARAGHHEDANALFMVLKPLIRLLFSEPNPAPIKKYLAHEGWLCDELRAPMTPASNDLGLRIRRVVQRLPAEQPAHHCPSAFAY